MSSSATKLPAWCRSTLAIALLGSFLLWASLPNILSIHLGTAGRYLGLLGWIAPIPWLILVRFDKLPGRRPYRALYFAGVAFWLGTLYWLSLPHPAVIPLWFLLAAYLAIYLPLFVGLSRVGVHRFGMPLWLAAPIVWTGLELARAHMLTGFLMASLAHTQFSFPPVTQISDLVGEYGVDFVIVLVAACLVSAIRKTYFVQNAFANLKSERSLPAAAGNPKSNNPQSRLIFHPTALIPAAIALCATLGYGFWRLQQTSPTARGPRVALIQGNSLADWKTDESKQSRIMSDYIRLSEEAIRRSAKSGDGRPPSLIVWPETMYRYPLRDFEAGFTMPTETGTTPEQVIASDRRELGRLATHLATHLLVGIDRIQFIKEQATNANKPAYRGYNSAALVEPNGNIAATYDKMHLVMFGEYVPFSHWLPFLGQLSSLTGSVEAGTDAACMYVEGHCYVPNICYETAIPQVIRGQIATIERRGEHAYALVNLTNDSWYWGSSGLDQHLACGVFRAIEARQPLVIAANGGISAYIDSFGRIRAESPRSKTDVIIADLEPSSLTSSYVQFGDWFSGICLVFCIVFAATGWRTRRQLIPAAAPAGDRATG